jgi:hypothetical protein
VGSSFLKIAVQYNIPVWIFATSSKRKEHAKMGKLSLFGKMKGIGRDSRKEQVMLPVTSALEIELTDEELATIRGGHGHHDDDDHGHWRGRRRWWWRHDGWHGDDDD